MLIATATLAQMSGYPHDHMDWNDGSYWVMAVVMVVVAAAAVAAIVWAIRSTSRPMGPTGPTGPPVGPSPRDVLDQRYARGEIDTADYNERRSALG